MHVIAFVALMALLGAPLSAADSAKLRLEAPPGAERDAARESFARFKRRFARRYASVAEEAHRLAVFVQNKRRAAALDAANPAATFDAERSPFGDVSADAFRRTHHNGAAHARRHAERIHRLPVASIPAAAGPAGTQAVDWRKRGAVTPIKNQGDCGSCWTFSVTGNIEGQWFLAGHPLTSLAEQQLVSCEAEFAGCDGGFQTVAFDWFLERRGGKVVTEASWPYVSGNGTVPTCAKSTLDGKQIGAVISGYQTLPVDEDMIASWVFKNGPLSISVDASLWQSYVGGVMTSCTHSSTTDHAVLLVGFDQAASPPYWIVKNSWGTGWGEEGYIRLEMGTNQCLMDSATSSAIVSPSTASNPPAPAEQRRVFRQYTCSSASCKSEQCTKVEYASYDCIKTGTSSFRGACAADGATVEMQLFATPDCSGPSVTTTRQPVGQCAASFDGLGERFVRSECPANPAPVVATYSLIMKNYDHPGCVGSAETTIIANVNEACVAAGANMVAYECSADGQSVTVKLYTQDSCTGEHATQVVRAGQCGAPVSDSVYQITSYKCAKVW